MISIGDEKACFFVIGLHDNSAAAASWLYSSFLNVYRQRLVLCNISLYTHRWHVTVIS